MNIVTEQELRPSSRAPKDQKTTVLPTYTPVTPHMYICNDCRAFADSPSQVEHRMSCNPEEIYVFVIAALKAGDVLDPQDIALLQSAADNGYLSPEEMKLFETEQF